MQLDMLSQIKYSEIMCISLESTQFKTISVVKLKVAGTLLQILIYNIHHHKIVI